MDFWKNWVSCRGFLETIARLEIRDQDVSNFEAFDTSRPKNTAKHKHPPFWIRKSNTRWQVQYSGSEVWAPAFADGLQ